jgi:hypothetical protein
VEVAHRLHSKNFYVAGSGDVKLALLIFFINFRIMQGIEESFFCGVDKFNYEITKISSYKISRV